MEGRWLRIGAGIVAFAVVTALGILLAGGFPDPGKPDPVTGAFQRVADALALILAVALLAGIATYLVVERLQTGRLHSIAGQFTTRTLVLIPVAIALNIILGATVANSLKIPIYLDSIGTILVGALAGPLAGAMTGFAANILWSYVIPLPFQSPPAAAFALVAAIIGLLAGGYTRLGLLRPRPDRPLRGLLVAGLVTAAAVLLLAWLAFLGYRAFLTSLELGDPSLTPVSDNAIFTVLGWVALLLVAGTLIGLFAILLVRRDVTAAYVVVCGLVTGVVAALISAPISAGVFGGVTGAGTDFLVAALRQAGADIGAATLGQGLISDPIDKITTFFVVYLILSAMARRTKARFPQGERLIERDADDSDEGLREAYA